MTSIQNVFKITDLIKKIGGYKHEIELNDDKKYLYNLLRKLNKLTHSYINKVWQQDTINNPNTYALKNKKKKNIVRVLEKIENIYLNDICEDIERYTTEMNILYNIVFMDMNNKSYKLKEYIERNPYVEMGPLFFITYKYCPRLNNLLNDYGLNYPISY